MVVLDVLLTALLVLVVGLLGLAALLLLMPLGARAEGEVGEEALGADVRLSWGLGLLGVRWSTERGAALYVLGLRAARLRPEPEDEATRRRKRAEKRAKEKAKKARKLAKKKEKEAEARRRGERPRDAWFWLARRQTMLRLAGRALALLHPRGELRGVVGLGDPADTAMLRMVLSTAAARVPRRRLRLDLGIDDLDETVELQGAVQMWVWPPEILGVALALLVLDAEARSLVFR